MGAVVLLAERLPLGPIVRRQAGVRRRDVRPSDLQRIAGDDANERFARRLERRERDDVVFDDHVRRRTGDDLAELRFAVLCPVDQRLPGRLHEGCELLDGRLPELRRRVPDEVLPELTRVLGRRVGRWRRCQVDEILDEAEGLQPSLPGRLGREHDAMTAPPEHVTDADAVVRRAEGRLRHEQDGQGLGHDLLGLKTPRDLRPMLRNGNEALEGVASGPTASPLQPSDREGLA